MKQVYIHHTSMEHTQNTERRNVTRFPIELIVRLRDQGDSKTGQARTFDISSTGLGLVTLQPPLDAGAPVDLYLQIPDMNEEICIKGVVIWSRKLTSESYRMGLNVREPPKLKPVSIILRAIQSRLKARRCA